MIVNTQLFNYKLYIGALIVGLVALSSFGYYGYTSLMKEQTFVLQENNLIESELSEMIVSFEDVTAINDSIVKQLKVSEAQVDVVRDSVVLLKNKINTTAIINFDTPSVNNGIVSTTNNTTTALINDNSVSKKELAQPSKLIKTTKQVASKGNDKVNNLKSVESKLKQVAISNVVARGVKRVTASNYAVETSRFNKAKSFKVDFTLLNNPLLDEGSKDIYIQILDSKMNVIANKGTIDFGNTSLIYSALKTVNYTNKDLPVSVLINKDAHILTKGVYFISIFYEGKNLGRTTLTLK